MGRQKACCPYIQEEWQAISYAKKQAYIIVHDFPSFSCIQTQITQVCKVSAYSCDSKVVFKQNQKLKSTCEKNKQKQAFEVKTYFICFSTLEVKYTRTFCQNILD